MDLEQFHTVVHVVCVPSFKIIMYKEHCIFLQTEKEKYVLPYFLLVLSFKCSWPIRFYSNCLNANHNF
jgi:hypothetical protein